MFQGRKKINLTILLLFLLKIGTAEVDCIFEHLSTENGLSHGKVSAMFKDRFGFMWFATWDGINRYDGTFFKTFKPANTEDSPCTSNRVELMKEDSLGNIWIVTYDSRAFRLNRVSEQFEPIPGNASSENEFRITGIFPASSGDVWVSTDNTGVFRVISDPITNEISIIPYSTQSQFPLPGKFATFINEDSFHRIWINTSNGITCLEQDPNSGHFVPMIFPPSTQTLFKEYLLTSFYSSGKQLFFGTQQGQLILFNGVTQEAQVIPVSNNKPITAITGAANNTLILGTSGNGLFEYYPAKNLTKHFNQPEIQTVLNLYVDSKELLWIESMNPGISKIDLQKGIFKHYQQKLDVNTDLRPNAQCGMMEDENQTLWLTLKGGGFGYYNPQTDDINYFYNEPGNPRSRISNFVSCFYKDASGVLWLSTYFKGIEKITFTQKKFRFIQPAPQSNLSIANEVRAMLNDSRGYLWIATKRQEIFILDSTFRLVRKITSLNGQKPGMVYAMLEDEKGFIYLGTKGNGLFRLTRSGNFDFKITHYVHQANNPFSLSNNNIYSLLEDAQHRIWIATYGGGINLLANGQFFHPGNAMENYPVHKGMRVRHLAKDNRGNIWAGTTDGLLLVKNIADTLRPLHIIFYNKENGNISGLGSNDIFWILCDRQNRIWMASLGGGLARLNSNPDEEKFLSFSTLTQKDGLPSDVIFTIIDDNLGKLWMSTENGITCFDPDKQVFSNYNRFDGIVNSAFSEAACTVLPDGSIGLGANNGCYFFQPAAFHPEQKQVPLAFTGFQIFGKEVVPETESEFPCSIEKTTSIRLTHHQNVLGLRWSGLDYRMQDNLQYAYKLDGFDNDWLYAGNQNQATYTKLPPGKYTFQVRFMNPELQALNPPKAIHIEILPPPWKSPWAYFIYFVLAVGLLELVRRISITLIRLRNNIVVEQKLTEIKLNFFTQISHELRTPLTLILGPVHELKNKEQLSSKGNAYINLIEQNAHRLLSRVNQLLDFRKIQSSKMKLDLAPVDFVTFTKTCCQNFEELAREKHLFFSVHSPNAPVIVQLDEEKMELVMFNLLSNAFKFTPNGGKIKVLIQLAESGETVSVQIKDTGTGISKEQEDSLFQVFSSSSPKNPIGTGIGLALSKELVSLHQGDITYRPNPQGGSVFEIVLKTTNPIYKTEKPAFSRQATNLQQTKPAVNENGQKPRILIVEDSHDLRTFLTLQLTDDFEIDEAVNGSEALTKARQTQPELILTDVMMPVMDGIQLLDKLKNNFETSHIPVVLLTAKSSVESKIEGLQYGADAYLTKPFNSNQLKAQIKNLLKQRQMLRQQFTQPCSLSDLLPKTNLTHRDTAFLSRVQEIIETRLYSPAFRIEDVYKELGMGRSKFFNKLKGLTGLSPIDFVKEYRLNKAIDLLQKGECNVSEASFLSGFTDAGYFSKCFKERFGMNPSEVAKR